MQNLEKPKSRVPFKQALAYALYLYKNKKYAKAERTYLNLLQASPDHPVILDNLGNVLWSQGRVEEAEKYYRLAIKSNPLNGETYHNLGNALQNLGKMKEAESTFREAIKIKPTLADTYRNLVMCNKYTSVEHEDERAIQRLLQHKKMTRLDKAYLYFALGKIYDDCRKYEEAFAYFKKANDIKYGLGKADLRPLKQFIDSLTVTFTDSFFKNRQASAVTSELPVFVVGMPRSGTTLVEQILASHPQVFGAGELVEIEKLAKEIPSPTGQNDDFCRQLACAESGILKEQAEKYLSLLREICSQEGVTYIINKMPTNFIYLGFIALLFPKARIIHCVRDGMDTCLSNYFTCFHSPSKHTYHLQILGEYYAEYCRIMKHWQTVLPLRLLPIEYEKLVSDPEPAIRRLLDFLELEWDDACLSFNKQKRVVQTASSWQVRQPIHTGSVKKWKHYEAYLAQLHQYMESAPK